jgi:hypothetical protein
MLELMYETHKFINAEDAFEAQDKFPSKKKKELEERCFESPENIVSKPEFSKVDQKNVGSSSGQGGQLKSFTPLNMSIDQVLLQIQDDLVLRCDPCH